MLLLWLLVSFSFAYTRSVYTVPELRPVTRAWFDVVEYEAVVSDEVL